MWSTLFEFLIAPVIVGAIITLLNYWLNREDN